MNDPEWTEDARRDLAAIDDHYAENAPDYADRIGRGAISAARFLAERPHAGPEIDIDGARKWTVPRTPYLLIYRILRSHIQILRVRHVREDWRKG